MNNIIVINNKKYVYDDNKDTICVKQGVVYINDEIAQEIDEKGE